MKDQNYIQISGWMLKLNISGNDLITFALIYGFSQDGQSYYTGSLKYIQDWLNVSKSTAMRSLDKLVELGYILKESETKNNITFNRYRYCEMVVSNCYRPVQNEMGGGVKMNGGGGVKMKPNNTIIHNTNLKERTGATETVLPTLFPEADKSKKTLFKNSLFGNFEKFKNQFLSEEFKNIDLLYYFNSVNDWSDQKDMKRTAQGWLATVRTWMRRDLDKGALKTQNSKGNEDREYMEYLKMSHESGY